MTDNNFGPDSDNADNATDDDDTDFEEMIYFVGPCTCEHSQEEHGWGGCNVEGCDCTAGWEE